MRTAAALLLALLASSPTAAADPEQVVAEARRAFDSGRFKEAAAKYLEAAGAPGLAADRVADLSVQAAWASYIDGDAPAARTSLRKAYLARPELEVLPEFYSEDFARLAAAVKSQTAPPAKIDIGELKRSARERLAAGLAQDVLYDLRRVPESGDPELHRLAAQALEKLGKADEADAERRRAAELETGVVTQSPIGALPSPPPPQPAPFGPVVEVGPMLEAAETALAKNDTRGAAELARRAADGNPRSSSAHRILGDVALAEGDAATAEREYIAATAIDPNDAKAEIGLGRVADRARQPNTAAAHYRRALEIDSHSLAAALGLGEALDQAGDKPSARQAFGRATEIDPRSAAARDRYGVFLLGSGDVGAAIDQGVEAVRLEMATAAFRAHLGLSYLAARMHKEADRELTEAVRLDPKNPAFENALGTSKLRQGDFTAASEAFTRARALAPGDETASTGLAAAMTAAGKPVEAEAVLRQAGADLPRSFAIANDLGVVEVRLGNYDAAVAAFTRALEISPESADAAAALARAASLRGFQAAAVAPSAQ